MKVLKKESYCNNSRIFTKALTYLSSLMFVSNFAFYKRLFFLIKNLKHAVFKSRMCFSESKAFDKSIIIVRIVCTLFSIVRRVSITLRFLKYFRKNRKCL